MRQRSIRIAARRVWLCRLLALAAAGQPPAAALAATASGLPPPPREPLSIDQADYYLVLVVNGTLGDRLVPVTWRAPSYYVQATDLRSAGLPLPADQSGLLAVDRIPGVNAQYDAPTQQLRLTVPTDWLPSQSMDTTPLLARYPAVGNTGALLNYDLYAASSDDDMGYAALWSEQRVFGRFGVFANTGVYRRNAHAEDRDGFATGDLLDDGYIRYDSRWRFNDEDRMIAYQAGDVVSDSLSWSRSVRLGGIRIGRNFGVRPDLITYPTLNIDGSNDLPSTVELFVNGYKASSGNLQAGPFTINDIPQVNGAGEATVITTDALGRQVSTSVPFYVANSLLRPGLTDFDLSLGPLRHDYGIRNFSYGKTAFSGIYRIGVTRWLSLSTHAETVSQLRLLGGGADLAVGRFGVASLASSHSRDAADEGWQHVVGYSYNARAIGINLQHTYRSSGFTDLSAYANDVELGRRATQATVSFMPFDQGNVSVGYYDLRTWDQERTRLLNLSYSRTLVRNVSMHLSVNRALDDGSYSAYAQLLIPLDSDRGMVSASVRRNPAGAHTEQINWSRSAPTAGGLGWNLGYATTDEYRQASATWLARAVRLQGGIYGDADAQTRWADVSGALVWMDGETFAANRISDAFVLVSTGGYAGVPIRHENRLLGSSNRHGHLLVPSVSSYYPAKFSIDALQLGVDVRADTVEQRLAVREGSGAVLRFTLSPLVGAVLAAQAPDGQWLPPGLSAEHLESGQHSYTGYEGQLYFDELGQNNLDNHIRIQLDQERSCVVQFALPAGSNGIQQIGPRPCQTEPSP